MTYELALMERELFQISTLVEIFFYKIYKKMSKKMLYCRK